MVVDALVTAIILLLIITAMGIIWAIIRERHMVNMHNQQTNAMNIVRDTIADGTQAIEAGFDNLKRQAEHSDDISETKRQEIIRLILDSERRCMDTMRDLIHNLQQQGMNVNFNQDASGTQIGNQNRQKH